MKFNSLDMSINSLTDLYDFLEEKALILDYTYDFAEAITKLKGNVNEPDIKLVLQWELACFSFEFRGADLFSLAYCYDSISSHVNKYPSFDDFEAAGFSYINDRGMQTKNPLLRARYNHLLWKAPKGIKNKTCASIAIEGYVESIRHMMDIKEKQKDTEYLQVSNLYETLVELCCEINFRNENLIKALTSELLFVRNLPFFVRHSVLDTMIKNPKYFKPADFSGTLNLFEFELAADNRSDDFLLVYHYLPSALKIAQKQNADVKKWHNYIGECFLRLAEKETHEDRFWIKQKYYSQAIYSFRNGGNVLKKQEVEQLYFELKPKVKLDTIRLHLKPHQIEELKLLYEGLDNDAKKIVNQPCDTVYHILSLGKGIFPRAESIRNRPRGKDYDFLHSVSRIDFDSNKNIADNKYEDKDEFFDPYHVEIQRITTPFLEYIFTRGIDSGKLTFENMILFLRQRTWMGRPFTRIGLGGEDILIDWIKLLAPSIVEYFVQTKSSLENKHYSPDYTLCIDSLVLKLEGLLRNFCEQLNLATNVVGKVGIQEANINQILEIEGLKQYFDEDDFLLFKYLLLNESGINLRNNVAHCFYNQDDYRRSKMHLLLATLLRIGMYEFKDRDDMPIAS